MTATETVETDVEQSFKSFTNSGKMNLPALADLLRTKTGEELGEDEVAEVKRLQCTGTNNKKNTAGCCYIMYSFGLYQ